MRFASLALALVGIIASISVAEAAKHHGQHKRILAHNSIEHKQYPGWQENWTWQQPEKTTHSSRPTQASYGGGGDLLSKMERIVGQTPSQLGIRSSLWCAATINRVLGGGTHSDMASSFAHYGRATSPHPGAIAVLSHGNGHGHVGVIEQVVGNSVVLIGGNQGHGTVSRMTVPISRFYAFRDI